VCGHHVGTAAALDVAALVVVGVDRVAPAAGADVLDVVADEVVLVGLTVLVRAFQGDGDARAPRGVDDGVDVRATGVAVAARTAVQIVVAGLALQVVVAVGAEEAVVAGAARQDVRLRVAEQRVVALTADDPLDVFQNVVALTGLAVVARLGEIDENSG